jgi:chromate reductase, NAD(P)H dehydrogenase (quinone)
MKIIALSGSLRRDSYNTRLARLLVERAPEEVGVELATLHDIPLYDGDLEASDGIPAAVTNLRDRIKASDGLIIVTPEYNAGMPGVLKNGLDWLTRPAEELKPTFGARPTALAGATPGAWGTALAQSGALITLRQLGVHLYPGYLRVSRAADVMTDNGIDDKPAGQAEKWLAGFVEFIGSGP